LAKTRQILTVAALTTLIAPAVSVYQPTSAAAEFADPAFQRVWNRTDKLVADKVLARSWYWGPTPGEAKTEKYVEGQGGNRLVQYFDKSRMEINNPNGNKDDPFFVTNGLLTVELVSGKVQVGNNSYEGRFPAQIPLASDNDDRNAPTYASFLQIANSPLGDHPANDRSDKTVVETVNRAGIVQADATREKYGVKYGFYNNETKHNIADKFWDFLNLSGPVLDASGKQTTAKLSDPWFYTTGYAISEPYWANVKIAGKQEDVLIQLFERRVLTYIPSYSAEWRVQMGNIGAHYYDWRYKGAGQRAITRPDVRPVTVAAGELGSTQNPIKMAFVPSASSARILASGEPLGRLLGQITGYSFKVSVPTSYAAVIESMGSNNIDVAWLAPFSYALAHQKYDAQVILSAVRLGQLAYPSVFITSDPNIKTLADFRGKKFAFVDPASASGYLYPIAAFKSAGLVTGSPPNAESFFGSGNVVFAGGHDRVVTAVYNGQVAGGAVFGGPLNPGTGNPTDARSLVSSTLKDVYQKVRIIGDSQLIPNDTVSVRKGLPADMTRQIQQGLLELAGTGEGNKYIVDLYAINDLAPVTDSFYDPLRKVAEDAGITNFESLFPTPTPRPPATPTP
jgi:phosphate/phosphite/phosphonate ABC transporter binding protein